jgi:spore coat protein U-like protein
VNPALDEVLTLTDGGAKAVGGAGGASTAAVSAHYVSAAARYERLAKDLGPMEFSSEQTAKSVAEYAGVLSSTAQTLRTLASALDANNGVEADRANRELERLNIRERSAVSRIDAWCQGD